MQDTITKGSWSLNLGLRGDIYNGLTTHREAEPRLGVAYNVKKTNTVLRVSYARVLETPFNENLVLASTGCDSLVLIFAAGLRNAGRGDSICSRMAQRVSCRSAAGVWEVCGVLRRIHLEIHA